MPGYVLGLDLGPNSIGWAMLAIDESGNPNGFYDTFHAGHPPMGVRIFEAGLHNFDTAKEESLNQKRRVARSMRRNHARRNARRRAVLKVLQEAGLLPKDGEQLKRIFQQNPYELRALALDHPLEAYQLGRAIYHLAQRRGFKSNRKKDTKKEDKGLLQEIAELDREIKDSGHRTLGEHLYRLSMASPKLAKVRVRKRHTRRDMYVHEFHAIVAAQRQHHGKALTPETVSRLEHFLFYQHPFEITEERRRRAPSRANLHRAPSLRSCPLVPDEYVCPKSEWIAQEFRLLKELNNLRIIEPNGKIRDLTTEERELLLDELRTHESVKFDKMRKILAKAGTDPDVTFNLERGGRKALPGNAIEHKLAVAFGRRVWNDKPETNKKTLRGELAHADDPNELAQLLIREGIKQEKLESLIDWSPPDGYVAYSKTALSRIVPLLAEGLNEYEAISKAFPDRPQASEMPLLPALHSQELPVDLRDITNPVVRRTLVETRKVINTLIREHGKPDRIIVELAREMKQGKDARRDYASRIRFREREREEARGRVEQYGGNPHSRRDVDRWLMWKEQGGVCLYTGKTIPPSQLFSGGRWEVDHILPRWQSLDDSYNNKVLVEREANEDKGDRTPMQWLGDGSQEYMELLLRAKAMMREHGFPYPKFRRLLQENVDADDFAQRQLNDTRYISTAVARYLNLLYPPELRVGQKAVMTTRGGLTAELRRHWGLNSVLDIDPILDKEGRPLSAGDGTGNVKNRMDHRHHAIDAVVVALSSRSLLKRYQDYWKRRDLGTRQPSFELPWEGFRDDVQAHAGKILVSHRPDRKLRGALHEETYYGLIDPEQGRFVTRKPIENLSGKDVLNIRDDVIRSIISERLRSLGWDGKSNTLPKDWYREPLQMPSGVPIRRVRVEVTIKNAIPLGHRHAIAGNNHHIEIMHRIRDDGRVEYRARTVTMFEAARRVRPPRGESRRPLVAREEEGGWRLAMSLCRKDTVRLTSILDGKTIYCIVQKMSGSPNLSSGFDLYLRDVRDSRPATEGNRTPFLRLKSFKSWPSLGIAKVEVDSIGRARDLPT